MYLLPLSQSLQPPTRGHQFDQCQKTYENPNGSDRFKISSWFQGGQKTCLTMWGSGKERTGKKFWKLPGIVLFQTFCPWLFSTLYLHACVSSKLRCRCYIFFLYSRFLTLGKPLIRIMPEFGILLHIYIDSEALFLSTFLCTKASRQFSPPSPRTFRCCKVSPTLPSGKCKIHQGFKEKEKCTYGCFQK